MLKVIDKEHLSLVGLSKGKLFLYLLNGSIVFIKEFLQCTLCHPKNFQSKTLNVPTIVNKPVVDDRAWKNFFFMTLDSKAKN